MDLLVVGLSWKPLHLLTQRMSEEVIEDGREWEEA